MATIGPAMATGPNPGSAKTAGASTTPQMTPQNAPVPPQNLMRSPRVCQPMGFAWPGYLLPTSESFFVSKPDCPKVRIAFSASACVSKAMKSESGLLLMCVGVQWSRRLAAAANRSAWFLTAWRSGGLSITLASGRVCASANSGRRFQGLVALPLRLGRLLR